MKIREGKLVKNNKKIIKVETDSLRYAKSGTIIATTFLKTCVGLLFITKDTVYLMHYYSPNSMGRLFLDRTYKNLSNEIIKQLMFPGPETTEEKIDGILDSYGDFDIKMPYILYGPTKEGISNELNIPVGSIAYDIEIDELFGYDIDIGNNHKLFDYEEDAININNKDKSLRLCMDLSGRGDRFKWVERMK